MVLEHTLIILLLLVAILKARPKLPAWVWYILGAGILLSFIAPATPLDLPWDLVGFLVIPILFWQVMRRLVVASWRPNIRELLLWVSAAAGIAAGLVFIGNTPLTEAILLGLLVASMIWRASEEELDPSHLGQFGALALAIVLVELAPSIEQPDGNLLSLLYGAGIGAILGWFAVLTALQLPSGWPRSVLSIGIGYIAYATGWLPGISSVAAAALAVAVYISYGVRRELWQGDIKPDPMDDSREVYLVSVLVLLLFGWQLHVPLTIPLILETLAGLAVTLLIVILKRRFYSNATAFRHGLLQSIGRTIFLILPALLLWPREVQLDPVRLGFALLSAAILTFLSQNLVNPILQLRGWLAEVSIPAGAADEQSPPVRDFMQSAFITLPGESTAAEAAYRMLQENASLVFVEDTNHTIIGILSEKDLFIKEDHLPQSAYTYLALFNIPVIPARLPEMYVEYGRKTTIDTIMQSPFTWVEEHEPLEYVLELMLKLQLNQLPVLASAPQQGGKPLGVLRRRDFIRMLADVHSNKNNSANHGIE